MTRAGRLVTLSTQNLGRKSIILSVYNRGSAFCLMYQEKLLCQISPFPATIQSRFSAAKRHQVYIVNLDPDDIFDNGIFDAVWISSKVIRKEMYRQEGENIKRAEKN